MFYLRLQLIYVFTMLILNVLQSVNIFSYFVNCAFELLSHWATDNKAAISM
jgi:hypothetical protein